MELATPTSPAANGGRLPEDYMSEYKPKIMVSQKEEIRQKITWALPHQRRRARRYRDLFPGFLYIGQVLQRLSDFLFGIRIIFQFLGQEGVIG